VFFSPIHDKSLPDNINGLYLCGGYPELHLKELSGNISMLKSINTAITNKMPTIAECGGFLYLHNTVDGLKMAGAIAAEAYSTQKLQRFGYIELRADKDNMLCAANESIRSHEFHYYESTDCGADFTAQKPLSEKSYGCIHVTDTLYAGFPHLYFKANVSFAENFVRKVVNYALK
jgi:cobyrinic acid a,c-diamide synthase